MIKLIVGNKGSGKTKKLINFANTAIAESKGNVVLIEKGMKLTYDLNYNIRLINADSYSISGYDSFYGFISGVCAGNYDVTDVLIDGTLKIGGTNIDELLKFLNKIEKISTQHEVNFVITISLDASELPSNINADIIHS